MIRKKIAIEKVNNYLNEDSLSTKNTHIAKINEDKNVWWVNIPPERFSNDLHLLLEKGNGFLWLKIDANTFVNPKDTFRLRTDINRIDLEISNNKNKYMTDIKSDGTNCNFRSYIKHEFN